jgi:hypothetical protein
MTERVVGVRVPLTDDQKATVEAAGGSTTDVVVVGTTDLEEVENEVGAGVDEAITHAVWEAHGPYVEKVEGDEQAAASKYGRQDDRPPATLAYLRSTPQVTVPLSDEQREIIFAATGVRVSEVVLLQGDTGGDSDLEDAAARAVAAQQPKFVEAVDGDAVARESAWYTAGASAAPLLGLVR